MSDFRTLDHFETEDLGRYEPVLVECSNCGIGIELNNIARSAEEQSSGHGTDCETILEIGVRTRNRDGDGETDE